MPLKPKRFNIIYRIIQRMSRNLSYNRTITNSTSANNTISTEPTGTISLDNGLVGNPSVSFTNSDTTGWYSPFANVMAGSANSTEVITFSNVQTAIKNELNVTGQILGNDGTALVPSISFTTDNLTGLFLAGADQLGITCGGTERMRFLVNGIAAFSAGVDVQGVLSGPTIAALEARIVALEP
jgi:hypothetical protein